MKCTLSNKNIKYISKFILSIIKLNNEVRLFTNENEICFEVVKGEHLIAQLILNKEVFEKWEPGTPIDVSLKSKSLKLVFRTKNLTKNLLLLEIWIDDEQNFVLCTYKNRDKHHRVVKLPMMTKFEKDQLEVEDYSLNYPVHITSDSKTWIHGLKNFPHSVDLVTARFRAGRNIKMETGDERELAPMMTKFYFYWNEFCEHEIRSNTVCTFAIKPVKDFLKVWDPKHHYIESYFDVDRPIVFEVKEGLFVARIVLAKVSKAHPPDSPEQSGDENSFNLSADDFGGKSNPGRTSIQDPRNKFIYHAPRTSAVTPNTSRGQMQPPPAPKPVTPEPSVTQTKNLVSEGANEFFDDDDYDLSSISDSILVPSATPRSVPISTGEEDFYDDKDDEFAINESVRHFSQNTISREAVSSTANPIQVPDDDEQPLASTSLGDTSRSSNSFDSTPSSMRNNDVQVLDKQRLFFGLNSSEEDEAIDVMVGNSSDEE